jgi:hypothetical protein
MNPSEEFLWYEKLNFHRVNYSSLGRGSGTSVSNSQYMSIFGCERKVSIRYLGIPIHQSLMNTERKSMDERLKKGSAVGNESALPRE